MSLVVRPRIIPTLDPEFLPASLWSRAYLDLARSTPGSQPLGLALERDDGTITVSTTTVLPESSEFRALTEKHVERLLKFLLWQKGGWRVVLGGPAWIAERLRGIYSATGPRAFDHTFTGLKLFGHVIEIERLPFDDLPSARERAVPIGRHLDGCRIGFDLGGSDRKSAAVIDGQVVHSEEIPWDPYFQKDPAYHFDGIRDSLRRAAAFLPRVQAIGGSAAGCYVNNEVRASSLFRGVSEADFESRIRRIFFDVLAAEGWQDLPFEVVNDGEVTALAGSMSLRANNVLGISMGTSEAAGYVDAEGNIRPWLNELAFAPIDYRDDAPVDEWSGDRGCGVQYFSQQGVGRLAVLAGLDLPSAMPLAERLVEVQALMAQGDERARRIYQTIGVCFGYAIGHYASFYEIDHLLILGRVTSGEGGQLIISEAKGVLQLEFPELADRIRLSTPDEKDKRHGQAIAAASLPALPPR